jgi:hypothetical protein
MVASLSIIFLLFDPFDQILINQSVPIGRDSDNICVRGYDPEFEIGPV